MSATLQQRATAVLTAPQSEWPVIAAESDTLQGLYTRYIMPLAAIGAIATFIHLAVLGLPIVGRLGPVSSLVNAIVGYALQLSSVIISAVIIEKLAPRFKSSGDTLQAVKLVAYASTPVWLAGVFNISLVLTPLILIAALYAVYLFYIGLPHVLRTPPEQVVPFMVVAALVIIVVNVVFSVVVGGIGLTRM